MYQTKHGKAKLLRISKDYSIDLYIVELIDGKYKGEKMAITQSELRAI